MKKAKGRAGRKLTNTFAFLQNVKIQGNFLTFFLANNSYFFNVNFEKPWYFPFIKTLKPSSSKKIIIQPMFLRRRIRKKDKRALVTTIWDSKKNMI